MIDQAAGHVRIAGAVHGAQDIAIGMLERHVEVGQKRVVLGHHVDHPQRQDGRVDVEHAQTQGKFGNAFDDRLEQCRQSVLDAEIGAVADRVLGDEHDLLRPARDQSTISCKHVQRPLADLPALDAGDRAEGAVVVAAVGNLDVGGGSGLGPAEGGQHALAAGDLGLRGSPKSRRRRRRS